MIRHFSCLGEYALAHLAGKGQRQFIGISDSDVTATESAIKKAVKYAKANPRTFKAGDAGNEKLSKRYILRQLRPKERAKAAFHKQYTSYKERADFLATKKAQTEAQKQIARADRRLQREKEKNLKLGKELKTSEEERKRMEQLVVNGLRKKNFQRFMNRLSKKDYQDLLKASAEAGVKMSTFIIHQERFYHQFPEIAELFKQFLDLELKSETVGAETLLELQKQAGATPAHYIGPANFHQELDAHMKAAADNDYDAPHALQKEAGDLVQYVKKLGAWGDLGRRKRNFPLSEGEDDQNMDIDDDEGYIHPGQNPNHPEGLWSQPAHDN